VNVYGVATVGRAVVSVRLATWYIAIEIYEFPAVLRVKWLLFSCPQIEVTDVVL
jgi:hypothetical protein